MNKIHYNYVIFYLVFQTEPSNHLLQTRVDKPLQLKNSNNAVYYFYNYDTVLLLTLGASQIYKKLLITSSEIKFAISKNNNLII